jgi:hypothetical protein
MNVEIGTEAAQFPEKEYINGIFVAVRSDALTTPPDLIHSKIWFLRAAVKKQYSRPKEKIKYRLWG